MTKILSMVIEKKEGNLKRIVFYWLPPIAYMAVIFYISSRPLKELPIPQIWNFDKVIHAVEYGILGILWFRVLNTATAKRQNVLITAFIITFFYGIFDEAHQYFVPERSSSIYDAIADGFGGWVGIKLYRRRL